MVTFGTLFIATKQMPESQPLVESMVKSAGEPDIYQRLLAARLPSPPQTLLKLLALCQSDDVGMAELSELIGRDPAMTARVLAIAHSAAYHRAGTQAMNLMQACSRLGTSLIKVLVISESVRQTFDCVQQAAGADLRQFWKHSLSTALTARELARRISGASTDEAYLAGLLHEVGRLALLTVAPQLYLPLFDTLDDDALRLQEKRFVGMSHPEAGAWLLGRWHMSAQVVESVLLHHSAIELLAEASPLARIVHLANRLVEQAANNPTQACPGEQGLSSDELAAIVLKVAPQVAQIARALGMDMSIPDRSPKALASKDLVVPKVVDAAQTQLAKDALDRSVFNEMAMTLISQDSLQAALTLLRQHLSALTQLDESLVLLLRDQPPRLVVASMSGDRRPPAQRSFDLSTHTELAQCVTKRKVVFAECVDQALHDSMGTTAVDELVFVPLLTTRQCLGVLVANVPVALRRHLLEQTPMLQMLGIYAGLALSRRSMTDKPRDTKSAHSRKIADDEQASWQQMLDSLLDERAQAVRTTVVLEPIDLCQTLRNSLQLLQDTGLMPTNVEVKSQLTSRASFVSGSVPMLEQMVFILIKHACEVMPNGGAILVEGGMLVHRLGAMFTAVSVSCTGEGARQAIQAQLYQPLPGHSADVQQGSRLSLLSHLVDKLAGHLKFDTSPSGTRFDVFLPCYVKDTHK